MIEKDNIQELFSKAFENQTAPVRPDLWAGVQAKMAVAGVASTATVATKGLSALTKWIIGSAAVGTVGVVATVIALNSGQEPVDKNTDSPKEISQNVSAPKPEENPADKTAVSPNTTYTEPNVISGEPFKDLPQETNPKKKDKNDIVYNDMKWADDSPNPADRKAEQKSEDNKGSEAAQKVADDKKTNPSTSGAGTSNPKQPAGGQASTMGETPKKQYPEDTKEPVKVDLVAKVTHFPNVFTPNGDGNNDFYNVETEHISDFRLTVIDQDNKVVFETIDPNGSWDGTVAGDRAKEGMYAAIVTGKQQNGKSFRDIQLFELKR